MNSGGTLQVGGVYNASTTNTGTIATTGTIGSGTAGYLLGDFNFAGTLKFAQNGSSAYASILSGSGNIVKTGTGVVTLSGSNSFTGGATLTAGMLSLGSAGALGTTGTLSFNGGAIQYTGSNTTDYSSRFSTADNQQFAIDTNGQNVTLAGNLTNATSSFTKQNSGTATLTVANSFVLIASSGGLSGGVLAGTADSLATSGSANTGAGSEIQLTVSSGSASWAGDLYGSGTFSKLGAGTLTLTGSTTASAGTMKILGGSVVATTNAVKRAVQNSGSLTFDQTFTGTTSSNISGTGSLAVIGSGTVVLSGTSSYSGGTVVSAGAALEGTTASLQGAIVNDSKVTFRSDGNGTYAGSMSGTGVLGKYGSGSLTLTGTNTHTGGTVIGAGSIVATTNNIQGAIENNSLLVFNQTSNGTYAGDITGNSSGVVRLPVTTTGTITLAGSNSYGGGTEVFGGTLVGTTASLQGAITNATAVIFDQATAGTYAGSMSGAGSLTKRGGGTVNLTGSSSYAGATVVNGGGLKVNGSIAGSGLTVAAGATLSGTGTIGTNAVIQGVHAPGNSPGLQAITGDLTYLAAAAVEWELATNTTSGPGTNYDQVVLPSGSLLFSGSTTLDLSFDATGSVVDWSDSFWDSNRAWTVFDLGSGTTTGLESLVLGGALLDSLGNALLPTRGTFSTSLSGQDVLLNYTIAAVPEPATWVMALAGIAYGGFSMVRRRKRA